MRKLLLIEAQAFQAASTAGAPPAKIIKLGQAVRKETKSRRDASGPKMPVPRFVFPTPYVKPDPRICKGYGPRIMLELTRSPAYRPPQERRTHKRLCLGVRLGLRYAALIRVIANPKPFAMRLAKRLIKTPKLFAKIAAYPEQRDTYLEPLMRAAERTKPIGADSS